MSYCRMGPDSDVYVFRTFGDVYSCCACRLSADRQSQSFVTAADMLHHLHAHLEADHRVPIRAMKRLRGEASDG